eukprot:6462637-Ditylum_brightwellii.AAC.1
MRVVGNKDNGVDNSVDNSVDDSVDNSVAGSDDSGDKHLTNLSQAINCHLIERSKQNKCVDGNNRD